MAKITSLLFILLLLGCNEIEAKPPEHPSPEQPLKLGCDSTCDEGKIKAWYQKKYGEPITDFELSARFVYFRTTTNTDAYDITLRRTSSGASCKSAKIMGKDLIRIEEPYAGDLTAQNKTVRTAKEEIGMEEWLDFMRGISKSGIDRWERRYGEQQVNYENRVMAWNWTIQIVSLHGDKFYTSSGSIHRHPENWADVDRIMGAMNSKIFYKAEANWEAREKKTAAKRKEAEARLGAEYQKRFGEPITGRELSARRIDFDFGKGKQYSITPLTVYRLFISRDSVETYAKAKARLYKDTAMSARWVDAELSMGEWLDFVRALHKTRFYEWEKKLRGKSHCSDTSWKVDIKYLDKKYDISHSCEYFGAHSKDWAEFKRIIMHDMESMIKEKALARKQEVEARLGAEYQKRFGEPITERELSATKVRFSLKKTDTPDEIYSISVNREIAETNVRAIYNYIQAELGIKDWLDFVRAFRENRIHEWKKNYVGKETHDGFEWVLITEHLVKVHKSKPLEYKVIEYEGKNAYPPNWAGLKKAMDDIATKIKKDVWK
jgi:hypothetical protein